VLISLLIRIFCVFSREFSRAIFDPKFGMWCWCLALNFM